MLSQSIFQDFQRYLFLAALADWPDTSHFAHGRLEKQLGLAGIWFHMGYPILNSHGFITCQFQAISKLKLKACCSPTEWILGTIHQKFWKRYHSQKRDGLFHRQFYCSYLNSLTDITWEIGCTEDRLFFFYFLFEGAVVLCTEGYLYMYLMFIGKYFR